MGSMSVRKGKTAERAFVAWMRGNGWPTIERRLSGDEGDTGDTIGHPGLVFDVKNRKTIDLAGWVDQLGDEMDNAGVDVGVVVAKRRGKQDPGEWYAVTSLEVMSRLLRQAGYGEPVNGRG